jgi:exonuclease III
MCVLRYKTDELYSSLYPELPHILCITEHHLYKAQLLGIGISNYKLGASYCKRNSKKGGECIYVRENITSSQVDITNYCTEYDIEACVLKVHLDNTIIHILTIYRSPKGDFSKFLEVLDNILRFLINPKTEIIICGDISANLPYQ